MLVKPFKSDFTLLHSTNESIYTLAYNGFYEDYSSLFHIMELQDTYLSAHPDSSLALCTLFYNTNVTPEVMDHYIAKLEKHADKIKTLAIVGIPMSERALFRLKLKKSALHNVNSHFSLTVRHACDFFSEQPQVHT